MHLRRKSSIYISALYVLRYGLVCSIAPRKISAHWPPPKFQRNGSTETSRATDRFFPVGRHIIWRQIAYCHASLTSFDISDVSVWTSEKVGGQQNFNLILRGPLPPKEYVSVHIWASFILVNGWNYKNLWIVQMQKWIMQDFKLKCWQKVPHLPFLHLWFYIISNTFTLLPKLVAVVVTVIQLGRYQSRST